MIYRAAPASALLVAPLDAFSAVFHRASGITHLLTEPAPEILAALVEEAMTLEALLARLAIGYDLADADRDSLAARLDELVAAGLVEIGVKHRLMLKVGPASFRIGSAWRAPIAALAALYADYPAPAAVSDFTVRLEPARPWRRWLRPSVAIGGDYRLPEAAPLPLAQGLLAAEMAMNLQMALGWRRHLLLHAAVVERGGRALILTGASGSGKSTLAALLARKSDGRGWRFLGDEFGLLDPVAGTMAPFPRPASLKNASIGLFDGDDRHWGPLLTATPKGDIRHLVPDAAALAAMGEAATPALIVFPGFGFARNVRAVPPGEAFMRLTQASTNYTALGEAGFTALTRLVGDVPAVAVDYPDTATALTLIDDLWNAT